MLRLAEQVYLRLLKRRQQKFGATPPTKIEGCRVVSVGNLTVGGTGKTPTVQWLAREMQNRGARVAVVARGYRGRKSDEGAVVSDGQNLLLNARDAGDEPLLHTRALPGVAVVIGRDRVKAAQRAANECGANSVVLDDAFGYYSLARDFDLVLMDARRPFDNGHLLPRGRLREPASALGRADAVLLTRCNMASAAQREDAQTEIARWTKAPVFQSSHAPVSLRDEATGETQLLDVLQGAKIGALSALADNAAFAQTL
ncbi:MAG TPA: tetraacyldisaccharide 4'-kinase, partial [Abditibacteriaceae bacterium]